MSKQKLQEMLQDTSDCSIKVGEQGVCSSPEMVRDIKTKLLVPAGIVSGDAKDIVTKAMEVVGVESEGKLLEHPDVKSKIGTGKVNKELDNNFNRATGAVDPIRAELLDNFDIDDTLTYWATHSKRVFGKKFKHIPFQMIDFESVGSELARTSVADLICQGYHSFGCVLNTDYSSGGGKHWFCLYGDFEHAGTENDPYRLEYFNSSGKIVNRLPQVQTWLEKSKAEVMVDKRLKKYCEIVQAAPKALQFSRTECGVWSLIYIKGRLQGLPCNWFYEAGVTDADIKKLREHIFRKP